MEWPRIPGRPQRGGDSNRGAHHPRLRRLARHGLRPRLPKALPMAEIVAEFQKETGQQFDPRVADVLLELIDSEPPQIAAPAQASGEPMPETTTSGPRGWAHHMQTVEALGQQLARATSIEDICSRIGATISTLVPHDQCRVLLMNEDRTQLEVVYLKGTDREEYRAGTSGNAAGGGGEAAY